MIKIEFPAGDMAAARVFGEALTRLANGAPHVTAAVDSFSKTVGDELPPGAVEQHVAEPAPEDVVREAAAAEEQEATEAPNDDSTSQAATQEQKAAGAHAAGDGAQVDEKGVPFNGEFCGRAAVPFYGSGKKKGQWKKRQGVDEDAYDEWYAEALLGANIVEEEPADTAQTETTSDSNIAASMFANSGQQQTAAAGEDVPQDAGQLMKWVSEQQAAGNINQQQVTNAYTALQLPFDAIMNPAYPVAQNCAAIYNHLKGQI